METNVKPYPVVKFKLNQSWNGNKRGDVIEVGPGLLDALQRGNRGEVVKAAEKMIHAKPLNKSLASTE